MPYDEKLAERIRAVLAAASEDDIEEKRIVGGGLGFMRAGKMFAGVMGDELMVRVDRERSDEHAHDPHVRPLEMKGRKTASYVLVDRAAVRTKAALAKWLEPPEEVDPRVQALIEAMRADEELAPVVEAFDPRAKKGRKFGANGLKVDGKLFALFTQGTLVVKLPADRVAALVSAKKGKPFDPGHGRLMREWLAITSTRASWLALVKEAHAFVAGATRRSAGRSDTGARSRRGR